MFTEHVSVHRGVHGPGRVSAPGGAWCWGVSALGVLLPGEVSAPGGLVETPPTATATGGTHPT